MINGLTIGIQNSLNQMWGWSGNGNKITHADPYGSAYINLVWKEGDVLGCGLNLRTGVIWFTINGLALPPAFEHTIAPTFPKAYDLKDPAYPAFSAYLALQGAGQVVKVNFGADAFSFRDIDPVYVPTKKAKAKKKSAKKEEEGCCSKIFSPIGALVGFGLAIFLLTLKALFDISLLHSSLGAFVPVISLPDIFNSIGDVFDSISLPGLTDVARSFASLFDYVDFLSEAGVNWNCGGVLSLIAPVVIIVILVIMLAILQQDVLLKWAISNQKTEKDGCLKFYGYKALTAIGASLLIAALQIVLVAVTALIGSVWGIQRSCSAFDAQFVALGKVLCIACTFHSFSTALSVEADCMCVCFFGGVTRSCDLLFLCGCSIVFG